MHQFRQAYDYDRTELGQFSESPEDRATRRAVERLDRSRSARRGGSSRPRATSPTGSQRSTGLDAEVLPQPPQELAYRTAPAEDFVLSVNRLDRAKRIDLLIEAAKARAGAAGRDRRRGARPRAARGARRPGSNGRSSSPAASTTSELADLYARCLAVYYAPVDEDFGMVPYEAFLSAKPVVTTIDAGGPLEVVHDRETGLVVAPDAGRARARVRVPRRATRTRRRRGAAPARRSPSASPGTPCIDALLAMKVAYYSPLPPSRSGIADYSALLLPALRERIDVVVAQPGRSARRAAPTSRSTTSATTPTRTAGSSTRCASGPASSSCTSSSLHHLIAGITLGRGDGRGYLDAMERELGVVGRLLGLRRARQPAAAALGDAARASSRSPATILDLATGLIVHSHYVERRARERRLRRAALADPASRPGRRRASSPADGRRATR